MCVQIKSVNMFDASEVSSYGAILSVAQSGPKFNGPETRSGIISSQ